MGGLRSSPDSLPWVVCLFDTSCLGAAADPGPRRSACTSHPAPETVTVAAQKRQFAAGARTRRTGRQARAYRGTASGVRRRAHGSDGSHGSHERRPRRRREDGVQDGSLLHPGYRTGIPLPQVVALSPHLGTFYIRRTEAALMPRNWTRADRPISP